MSPMRCRTMSRQLSQQTSWGMSTWARTSQHEHLKLISDEDSTINSQQIRYHALNCILEAQWVISRNFWFISIWLTQSSSHSAKIFTLQSSLQHRWPHLQERVSAEKASMPAREWTAQSCLQGTLSTWVIYRLLSLTLAGVRERKTIHFMLMTSASPHLARHFIFLLTRSSVIFNQHTTSRRCQQIYLWCVKYLYLFFLWFIHRFLSIHQMSWWQDVSRGSRLQSSVHQVSEMFATQWPAEQWDDLEDGLWHGWHHLSEQVWAEAEVV